MTVSPTSSKSLPQEQWHPATWEDYCALRDAFDHDSRPKQGKLAFDRGWLWVGMGEGINHASFSDLLTSLLFLWAIQHPEQSFSSLGRCLLEKPQTQACALGLVLYVGEETPRWREGDPRRIDLSTWRVPDLVGEISDTSLVSDLDEQKHLYEALGIPEYWVIDVKGERVFAFLLNEQGQYKPCEQSRALAGLPVALLTQTVQKLGSGTNTSAAAWFAEAIATQGKP
ncbi:MAG: Uma2 family endonuclease [Cyanobacteria bacterium P01_A01_bin.135]